jgi:hypothetical protein
MSAVKVENTATAAPLAQIQEKVAKPPSAKAKTSTTVSLLAGGTAGAVEAFVTVCVGSQKEGRHRIVN